jgi:GGDEF domain-containing protein
MAQRIAEMLRATDIVGVLGPDVLVLLVHTPDTEAAMITDRIRDRLLGGDTDKRDIPAVAPGPLRIGLASFPTNSTSDGGLLAHAEVQLQAVRSE